MKTQIEDGNSLRGALFVMTKRSSEKEYKNPS